MVSARTLAPGYERYATAFNDHYGTGYWRTELAIVRIYMAWIESFWCDDGPLEPSAEADAISGGGGSPLVRWYDSGPAILGYLAGVEGCYNVPAVEAPPAIEYRPSKVARNNCGQPL